jgi:hypothetical protein
MCEFYNCHTKKRVLPTVKIFICWRYLNSAQCSICGVRMNETLFFGLENWNVRLMLCRCSQHPGLIVREITRMNLTLGSCYTLVFRNCSPLARKFWCRVLTSFLVSVWRYSILRSHVTRALGVHGTAILKETYIVFSCVDFLVIGSDEEIVWKLLKFWLYIDREWLDYTRSYTLCKQMLPHGASTHTSLGIIRSVSSVLLDSFVWLILR